MTETSCQIYNLSEFNAAQVERELMPPEGAATERQSMRHMFNIYAEEMPRGRQSKLEWNRLVAEMAIEKISFRYDLARHYEKGFFHGYHDHDALMLAVICDEYVNHINEPLEGEMTGSEGTRFEGIFRDDGFDQGLVCRAATIWDEAHELTEHGNEIELAEEPLDESLFLAHINALADLREMERELPGLSLAECGSVLSDDLPPMLDFAARGTEIGDLLLEFIGRIEADISGYIRAQSPVALLPAPPARPKPDLRLVTPDFQP